MTTAGGRGSGANGANRADARSRQRKRPRPAPVAGFWRNDPAPAEPIAPTEDATAMLRSLGPMPISVPLADYYVAAVITRAAALATALAASAEILAAPE